MPQVILTPEQRKVQLVSREPAPAFDPGNGAVLFSFPNLRKGDEHRVRMSWLFDRYSVETQVTPAKVPPYVTGSNLYRTFTAPDLLVPSTNPEIVKAATAAVGSEKNPYLRARRLYDWQLAQLSWSSTVRDGDAVLALRMKRADAFGYASLYCALLRAAGIPARMVSGVLVGGDRAAGHAPLLGRVLHRDPRLDSRRPAAGRRALPRARRLGRDP